MLLPAAQLHISDSTELLQSTSGCEHPLHSGHQGIPTPLRLQNLSQLFVSMESSKYVQQQHNTHHVPGPARLETLCFFCLPDKSLSLIAASREEQGGGAA